MNRRATAESTRVATAMPAGKRKQPSSVGRTDEVDGIGPISPERLFSNRVPFASRSRWAGVPSAATPSAMKAIHPRRPEPVIPCSHHPLVCTTCRTRMNLSMTAKAGHNAVPGDAVARQAEPHTAIDEIVTDLEEGRR